MQTRCGLAGGNLCQHPLSSRGKLVSVERRRSVAASCAPPPVSLLEGWTWEIMKAERDGPDDGAQRRKGRAAGRQRPGGSRAVLKERERARVRQLCHSAESSITRSHKHRLYSGCSHERVAARQRPKESRAPAFAQSSSCARRRFRHEPGDNLEWAGARRKRIRRGVMINTIMRRHGLAFSGATTQVGARSSANETEG